MGDDEAQDKFGRMRLLTYYYPGYKFQPVTLSAGIVLRGGLAKLGTFVISCGLVILDVQGPPGAGRGVSESWAGVPGSLGSCHNGAAGRGTGRVMVLRAPTVRIYRK